MNSVEHEHIIKPSLSGSDAAVTPRRGPSSKCHFKGHRNVAGLTISVAHMGIVTLSVQFADACDIAPLDIQITEPSDNA